MLEGIDGDENVADVSVDLANVESLVKLVHDDGLVEVLERGEVLDQDGLVARLAIRLELAVLRRGVGCALRMVLGADFGHDVLQVMLQLSAGRQF